MYIVNVPIFVNLRCQGVHIISIYYCLFIGGDDRRVMMWNIQKAMNGGAQDVTPTSMKAEHFSNIFCLGFDNENKKIMSGGA